MERKPNGQKKFIFTVFPPDQVLLSSDLSYLFTQCVSISDQKLFEGRYLIIYYFIYYYIYYNFYNIFYNIQIYFIYKIYFIIYNNFMYYYICNKISYYLFIF